MKYAVDRKYLPNSVSAFIHFMKTGKGLNNITIFTNPEEIDDKDIIHILKNSAFILNALVTTKKKHRKGNQEILDKVFNIYVNLLKTDADIFIGFLSGYWQMFNREDKNNKEEYDFFYKLIDSEQFHIAVHKSLTVWKNEVHSVPRTHFVLALYSDYFGYIPNDFFLKTISEENLLTLNRLLTFNISTKQEEVIKAVIDKINAKHILNTIGKY